MNRKGVELPVNVLVIVAIAVIVLLGLIALYMAGTGGPFSSISLSAAKQSGCSKLISMNSCAPNPIHIGVNFDVDGNGAIDSGTCNAVSNPPKTCNDNLGALLVAYYGASDLSDVTTMKQICGCPGY